MNKEFHFVKPKSVEKSILLSNNKLFQRKFDGISNEIFINNNCDVSLYGRGELNGKDSNFTKQFPELIESIKKSNIPSNSNFLAEAIVINPLTNKEDCGLASGRSKRITNIVRNSYKYPAYLIIHDVIKVDNINVCNESYLNRLQSIEKYITKNNTLSVIKNYTNGFLEWNKVLRFGLEGLIIRDPDVPFGKGGIYKLKQEITEDIYCKGEFEMSKSKTNSNLCYKIDGKTKRGVFANITCYQLTEQGKEILVCDVGGGFKSKDRIYIQKLLELGKITKNNPLVIEVKANGRHESGKLRNPNFLRIRTDKLWNECIIHKEIKSLDTQKNICDY